jgi:hypothetical protein
LVLLRVSAWRRPPRKRAGNSSGARRSATTDKDVVRVGRGEGRFNAIRLRVMDLKVVYANGQPDDIQVREEIRAGSQTRPLDLKGERGRAIKEIEMVYRSQPSFKGQATVCVDGKS